MNQLTLKQNMILESVKEYLECLKENPTSYKLQKYLASQGQKESLKSIMQVIEALEKKDIIKRDENHRIYIVENENYANLENIFSIPLYGLASCGQALAYADDSPDGYLQLSKKLFSRAEPAKLFAVKALGDSMDKDNISNEDYIIFEKCEGVNYDDLEGKIVIAVINGMATIKRFRQIDKNVIGLFPNSRNSIHQPIFIHTSDSILIAGVFKKVLPVKYVSL